MVSDGQYTMSFLYKEEFDQFFIELMGGNENSGLQDRPAKKQRLDQQTATGRFW